ncbi:MAG: hypothetical protein LC772_00645 [Chloroflexi bacterium]|nr:hypothetical protein [Chloroflexota bacterium]
MRRTPLAALTPHVEVPIPQPTVSQQLTILIRSGQKVDLLLLNGGAVDANLLLVMNPFIGAGVLAPRIDRIFRMDMRVVLSRAARAYPDTPIIVAPYFPIITEESDPSLLGPFLMAHGALRDEIGAAAARMAPLVLAGWIRKRVAANCDLLATRSTSGCRAAAEAVNAAFGRRQVIVADPPPVFKHAALTPDPWLFGINADMTPQDEVAGERKRACRCQVRPGFNRVRCCRASAGHLNPAGAARYAEAILQAIQDHAPALLSGPYAHSAAEGKYPADVAL